MTNLDPDAGYDVYLNGEVYGEWERSGAALRVKTPPLSGEELGFRIAEGDGSESDDPSGSGCSCRSLPQSGSPLASLLAPLAVIAFALGIARKEGRRER